MSESASSTASVRLVGGPFHGESRTVPTGAGGLTIPHDAAQAPFTGPFERYIRRVDGCFHHITVPFAVAAYVDERMALWEDP